MKNVYCPYCRKDVDYKVEKRQFNVFRGVEVNTYENVAVCKCCRNDLYVNELEDANIKRISEIYKEKENIITPDEIVGLRRKYAISQRELTSILDFGKMTINRYERGGLPTKSQSDYIKLLIENDEAKNVLVGAFDFNTPINSLITLLYVHNLLRSVSFPVLHTQLVKALFSPQSFIL